LMESPRLATPAAIGDAKDVLFQKLYPPPLAVERIPVPGAASVIQLP